MPASYGTHIQTTPTSTNLIQYNAAQPCRRIMHKDMPASQPCSRTLTYPQQRRQHSKIIMLYRIRHQLANIPATTYITPVTRNTQHYILPYARTNVFKSSFFPSTIKLWNNLQPAVINSTTVPQLRQALQSTPTSGRRGKTLSATYLGGHLTLTSITQLQHTNTPKAGRRGATLSATNLGGHLTLTSITQLQDINTPKAGRRGSTLSATYLGGQLMLTSITQLQHTNKQPVGVGLHYQLPIWVDTSRLLASHNYNIPTHQLPVGVGLHYQLPIWVDTPLLLASSPTHNVDPYN